MINLLTVHEEGHRNVSSEIVSNINNGQAGVSRCPTAAPDAYLGHLYIIKYEHHPW